ncbi:MAG TPA: hypothetical protein VMX97_00230 [Hyphomicrobiaceae bacterium]|nr:hypothetical protein [Hyphomicrobiaceae bacterium]
MVNKVLIFTTFWRIDARTAYFRMPAGIAGRISDIFSCTPAGRPATQANISIFLFLVFLLFFSPFRSVFNVPPPALERPGGGIRHPVVDHLKRCFIR